jgi:hypothetical protein
MDHARTRTPFVTWFTCGFENIDHVISDDDMTTGMSLGAGQYVALCGATVCAASMICPPGRRCALCQAAVLRVERDSSARDRGFFSQLRGRGRHRGDSTNSRAGAWHRLFGRWKWFTTE